MKPSNNWLIQLNALINENPDRAKWWSEQEIRTETFFRKNKPSYQKMIEDNLNEDQISLFDDEDLGDCFCHD